MNESFFTRAKQFRGENFWLLAIVVFIISGVLSIVYFAISLEKKHQPIEKTINAVLPSLIPEKESQLAEIIEEVLASREGEYGVFVKGLSNDESYGFQEHKKFGAASLYKLWVMKVTYDQLAKGTLSSDEVFDRDVVELNLKYDIATESAEKKEGKVKYTTSQALNQMITVSDNYAAYVLADRVGLGKVNTFLKENKFSDSAISVPPTTSAYDIAKFYELLYKGELSNPTNTKAMLTLLQQQQINYKLPKLLPESVIVAHKTGELGILTHDSGIVYIEAGDYIIVVLSESVNPNVAAATIAELSKVVYDYFIEQE